MNRARLGLEVRAVTQNPGMAASMGINPDKINMLTFGFGSGIAGIAGVAIGLYAKVTSEMGADYIVQAFMTVVVGGVGNIWGTLLGVLFLGERLSQMRLAGLICGLGGLFVVLGGAGFVPWPQNLGDWLALASGICWALGTLGLYKTGSMTISGQVFAFVLGARLLFSPVVWAIRLVQQRRTADHRCWALRGYRSRPCWIVLR